MKMKGKNKREKEQTAFLIEEERMKWVCGPTEGQPPHARTWLGHPLVREGTFSFSSPFPNHFDYFLSKLCFVSRVWLNLSGSLDLDAKPG